MKRIVFFANGKDEEVLITEKEWDEYFPKMDKGEKYWCERLQTVIPANIKVANTPVGDVGFDKIYLEVVEETGHIIQKWYMAKKADGPHYYRYVRFGEGLGELTEFSKQQMKAEVYKDKKNDVIDQEDYYNAKWYLPQFYGIVPDNMK